MPCNCPQEPGAIVLHDHHSSHSHRRCPPHGHSTENIYHNAENECGGTTSIPLSELVHPPAVGSGLIQVDENQVVSLAPFNADTTL